MNWWFSGRVLDFPSVAAGSIFSGIHRWGDLIRSKQLSSVSVCRACSPDFLLMVILLLFSFQIYFPFPTIFHRVLTPDLGWGKSRWLCTFHAFCCLFWVIFYSHVDSTLLRRGSSSARYSFFCISHRRGLPGLLLMYLFLPFLIISRAPSITDSVIIFFLSIKKKKSRFLYLIILLYSLIDMLLSSDTDISIRRHVFLLTTISGLLFFIFLCCSFCFCY